MATRTQNRPALAASGLTGNDLLARLQKAWAGEDVLPIGKGWKTSKQFAAEWNLGEPRTRQLLSIGYEKGEVERFEGKQNGCRVYFFRDKQS